METNLIVILGPTASGKTALAARLAADFRGEIISADSRQVYRGMDIGTGKDLSEFYLQGRDIPFHMIDILDPQDEFSVFEFQRRFYRIFERLAQRKTLPVLVGGTGLYLESVLTDYVLPPARPDENLRRELDGKPLGELQEILLAMKPDLHNKTDLEDRFRLIRKIEIEKARNEMKGGGGVRPNISAGVFGVAWERSELRRRIAKRLRQRLDGGMIEEVKSLREKGVSWERLDSFGLEYRFIAHYLQDKIRREEMEERLRIAIGQFAKRQMTWFRRMEKKGVRIEWIAGDRYDVLCSRVRDLLA